VSRWSSGSRGFDSAVDYSTEEKLVILLILYNKFSIELLSGKSFVEIKLLIDDLMRKRQKFNNSFIRRYIFIFCNVSERSLVPVLGE